eukprot:TRINITY_DN4610_c0_g1_i1.p1 TRINITY_DN4610_c0_g1~~TRINITY_DN4610_c0_g1_i1.p1  ORF type:complete len:178 (-),score=45.92 TRINITY_DN4610_c0_g1_i1:80-613(-)
MNENAGINVVPQLSFDTPNKKRKLNAKTLFEKVAATMSPKTASPRPASDFRAPFSPSTHSGNPSSKKNMVQEVCTVSQQLQDAEAESASAYDQRDSLQRTLVDMKARQQIQTSQAKTKIAALERKNKALREKNDAARRRVAQLQEQVDSIVSESWREHIYAQQSSEWFKDFERKMLN